MSINKQEMQKLCLNRSLMIQGVKADQASVKTYEDCIEATERNIRIIKMELKETRMQQIIDELTTKQKSLQASIPRYKEQIEIVKKEMEIKQIALDKVNKEIKKSEAIMAGEFYDDYEEIKDAKETAKKET